MQYVSNKGVDMLPLNSIKSTMSIGVTVFAVCLFSVVHSANGGHVDDEDIFPPVVNGDALRGLSTVNSAESMGSGRITFGFFAPWYKQSIGSLQAPNTGASVFTGAGSFSYGVNSYVDLFASVAGFGLSHYTRNEQSAGLGTIRAGVQGSLPFPRHSFLRMGAQTAIIGGTSQNQINNYQADGYNYFETRTGYDFSGKVMQTMQGGSEDWGIKTHLNAGGVVSINKNDPALMLLGAGVQGNLGFVVLGAEINSRTRFSDISMGTDPLWVTPSMSIRTPVNVNAMFGVDITLSADRPNNAPRALEPYRVFGGLAVSIDALAGRRNAEFSRKQKAEAERLALAQKAINDSIALVNEKINGQIQLDSLQQSADNEAAALAAITASNAEVLAQKAEADSLALVQAGVDLALEKDKRSDAEKKLLSTGELLLDAVYFESGKTVVSINSKPYLNIIGKMLLKYPKLQIEVAGYTDNTGSADFNLNLSQRRAEAVRNYMIITSPALASYLSARGYGVNNPIADNATKDGRQANRRVVLHVINVSALPAYSQQ
jgi:outer membrane protein OmpA-like peptidoglycan-associated protein